MAEIQTENIEYYPTVSGVIVHEDKVLLVLSETLGLWLAPNTHTGVNETPLDSLYRQIKDDADLELNDLTLLPVYTENLTIERDEQEGVTQSMPFDVDIHKVGSNGHHHVDSAYILVSDTGVVSPGSGRQVQWFDEDELDGLAITTEATKGRAKFALKKAQAQTK